MSLIICLIVAIAVMVLLMTYFKLDASIGLVAGALVLGISSGLGAVKTVGVITDGFAGLMKGIGLPIAFGVMIGKLVADIGGVEAIADFFMSKIKKKENTPYAMLATGFISSIPVFYDVVYVVVAPLARGLSKITKYPLPYFIGALVAGAGVAHCFILPTPGPLAGAEILHIPLGVMFIVGSIIGLISAVITYKVYAIILDKNKNFWVPEKDEDVATDTVQEKKYEKLPNFFLSILPIFAPILLILSGTVSQVMVGKDNVPEIIKFVSDRSMAMFLGAVVSIFVAWYYIGKEKTGKALKDSLSMLGVILLITGTGGAFGAVIQATGIGKVLVAIMAEWHISPIIFVWIVAAIIGGAQGSGTVGMITAATLIAPNVGQLGVSPVYLACAAFGGAMAFRWMNDSGFWVSTLVAKLTVSGGFKTYSAVCLIMAVVSLLVTLLTSMVWTTPFGI